jgi:hypothetical protein
MTRVKGRETAQLDMVLNDLRVSSREHCCHDQSEGKRQLDKKDNKFKPAKKLPFHCITPRNESYELKPAPRPAAVMAAGAPRRLTAP